MVQEGKVFHDVPVSISPTFVYAIIQKFRCPEAWLVMFDLQQAILSRY